MFASDLGNMPVIDDETHIPPGVVVQGQRMGTGLIARDYDQQPFGSYGARGIPFDVIPRSEWAERIKAKERNKTRIVDLCDHAGLTCLNQGSTNYCWINAPVHTLEIRRVVQNQKLVRLSPASVGAPIKNFRNNGGWGTEGLKYLVKHGCVPQDNWPANAIQRKYDTSANDALRPRYRVTEWMELERRNFDQLITCLLLGYPVAIGLNWWRHEVTAMDAVILGRNKYGVIIDNSWGPGWGENGRGVLTEKKATPDDAVSPRSVVAS